MSLRLKKDRNGKVRPNFYGRYMVDSKVVEVNLGVEWKGVPPENLRTEGNSDFERSRDRAQAVLDNMQSEAMRKGRAEHLTEKLIESKTGRKIQYTRLAELGDLWEKLPRGRKPGAQHLKTCRSRFERFQAFMEAPSRSAEFLHEVTEADANEYLNQLREEGRADETVKQTVNLLRGAFQRFLPVGVANPFRALVLRGGAGRETVHRVPFTPEELQKLFDVSEPDEIFHPLIVCAACTGMRRGDVCRLRWADVDLKAGVINCKAGKTSEQLEIPIFGPLQNVLQSAKGERGFVFPAAAKMIETDAGRRKLTRGFKRLVEMALSDTEETEGAAELLPTSTARKRGLKAIEKITREGSTRQERMTTVLKEYLAGASYREIEEQHGYRRGQISEDLQTIEAEIGGRIRRVSPVATRKRATHLTNVVSEDRMQSSSIRDWHALRVTFVTIALSAGVPMELVRRITGHKTVDIVLKHYFRPDREHFKAVMVEKMPAVLTGQHEVVDSEEELKQVAAKIAAGRDFEKNLEIMKRLLGSKQDGVAK